MAKVTKHAGAPGRCELSAVPGLATLDAAVLAELDQICHRQHYEAGHEVFPAGEEPPFIGFVHTGILRIQKRLPDGRTYIVGLLIQGDVFGQVFEEAVNFSVEAATQAEICRFPRGPFEALLGRAPELERLMLLRTQNELDRARDWMTILANHRVEERLAGFLLMLCKRFNGIDHVLSVDHGRPEVHVPISREDVAHLLGTRPETVSRLFHALADRGVLAIRDPARFEILDVAALVRAAGDNEPEDIDAVVDALGKATP